MLWEHAFEIGTGERLSSFGRKSDDGAVVLHTDVDVSAARIQKRYDLLCQMILSIDLTLELPSMSSPFRSSSLRANSSIGCRSSGAVRKPSRLLP